MGIENESIKKITKVFEVLFENDIDSFEERVEKIKELEFDVNLKNEMLSFLSNVGREGLCRFQRK